MIVGDRHIAWSLFTRCDAAATLILAAVLTATSFQWVEGRSAYLVATFPMLRVVSEARGCMCYVLQDCDVCNAGRGSNLTQGGAVECDASVMDEDGTFGAVGALPGALDTNSC